MSDRPHDNTLPAGSRTPTVPTLLGPGRRALLLWDQAAIYMPVLMMGALALGTYWLVRNTPVAAAPEAPRAVSHDIDYFMRNFAMRNFDDTGKLKSEVFGSAGRHYADTDILEVDQARVRSINEAGHLTTATADRAYANGDGSEVQLVGNAIVVREAVRTADGRELPRLEFRGEFLHAFFNEERVSSNKPVELTRGNDRFTGDNFDYDNFDQVANLKGRVRGVLMPKPRDTVPAR